MPGREDRIRARAYELWEREARAHGNHDRHWAEASRQVDLELQAEQAATTHAAGKAEPEKKSARSVKGVKAVAADKPAPRTRKPRAPKPA